MARVFRQIGGQRIRRSVFDLSHEYKCTCDIGQLIPVYTQECVPGDFIQGGNEVVVRLQPMIAPIFHELNVFVHYFFVPHRLTWKNWEKFITGGEDGDFEASIPRYGFDNFGIRSSQTYYTERGSLWDYLGYPLSDQNSSLGSDYRPDRFRQLSYNLIWYEYYRDQNLTVKDLDYRLTNDYPSIPENYLTTVDIPSGSFIRYRCWEKDYFTSALPRQQRGTAPAFPIRGTIPLDFSELNAFPSTMPDNVLGFTSVGPAITANPGYGNFRNDIINVLQKGKVDIASGVSFDVNEIRFAFQVQRWLERNMRAGARYTEHLKAHYGVSPRDDRLQRPEYLGGSKSPVIVSEVLQTSSTDTVSPQGSFSGHGLTVDVRRTFKYHVKEHGTIMGILSVMPRTAYHMGIDRTERRNTRYDFFFPEFQHLGEQAVMATEVYYPRTGAPPAGYQDLVFGFQGRYNEYRYARSKVAGEFRDVLNYWHMARNFSTYPQLNKQFVEYDGDKRNFAVQNYNTLLVNVGNLVRAVRPMVADPSPGLIDH